MKPRVIAILVLVVMSLASPAMAGYFQQGTASWYGPGFHGKKAANGETYNQNAMTAAHMTLPFGTRVRVTNLKTGKSVCVRITDRGDFAKYRRIIDLSKAAASQLGIIKAGTGKVGLEKGCA